MRVSRATAALGALLAFAVLAPNGMSAGAATHQDPITNLTQLRVRIYSAEAALREATLAYAQTKKELLGLKRQLKTQEGAAAAAVAAYEAIRPLVASVADAAYQQPEAADVAGLVTTNPPQNYLRSAADLSFVTGERGSVVERAAALQAHAASLVAATVRLRTAVVQHQVLLSQQIRSLRERSIRTTRELAAAAIRLNPGAYQDIRVAYAICDPRQTRLALEYPNGFIPLAFLCPLGQPGAYLRPDAAIAYFKMSRAYAAYFGHRMCVTSAYRSYQEEAITYVQNPALGALPGTSHHGLGIAVDFCDGVNISGSATYDWLTNNAARFGWFHPAWAFWNPFEPWHWEFKTSEVPAKPPVNRS